MVRSASAYFALLCSLTACDTPVVTAPQPPALQRAEAMILGLGTQCRRDADCGSPTGRGACILSTCFGLLTTENPAAQAALVERVSQAPTEVQTAARGLLMKVARSNTAGTSSRASAILGLGAILNVQRCDEVCALLRELTGDESLAIHARLALAKRLDDTVGKDPIEDLNQGTEQLRCAAGRRLLAYPSAEVKAALNASSASELPCLKSPGPSPSS